MIAIIVVVVVAIIAAAVTIFLVLRARKLRNAPIKVELVGSEAPADNMTNIRGTQESIASEAQGTSKPNSTLLVEQKLDDNEDVSGVFQY